MLRGRNAVLCERVCCEEGNGNGEGDCVTVCCRIDCCGVF